MTHLLLRVLGSVLYVLLLPIYGKVIGDQRRAGQEKAARAYAGIVMAGAVMMVVVPWLTL